MKEISCCFIGENRNYNQQSTSALKEAIIRLAQKGVVDFYSNACNTFDIIGAAIVAVLQNDLGIKNILVSPYPGFQKIKPDDFDTIIFLNHEKTGEEGGEANIRNKYIVDACQYAICYMDDPADEVYAMYEYAKKSQIEMINLAASDL
ncbi:MAG: hypothetical protein ACOYKJ_06140 [Candidatus Howiella sp.]|jgi:hypothetical protein